MSILEKRLSELGRIRIGDKVVVQGKRETTRPRRLENFRLTSINKPRLHVAAQLFGGEVTEWVDAPQGRQWQVFTETDSLPVVVPPFAALTQANEIWQGGECRLRCNGESIIYSIKPESIGQECYCASMPVPERLEKAKDGKACHTITRLSLILPDIPGVGVWRFETGSYYAGMELQGAAELLEQASAEGAYIESTLQIEERRVKRRTPEGKMQTNVFPVVVLQPNVSMRQLITRQIPAAALVGGTARPQLTQPERTVELWGESRPSEPWHRRAHQEEVLVLPASEDEAVRGGHAPDAHVVNAPVEGYIASADVPDTEPWRSALSALVDRLPPLFLEGALKALEDPSTAPGYGMKLLGEAERIVAESPAVMQEGSTL